MSFSSFFGLIQRETMSNPATLYAKTTTLADNIDTVAWYNLFVRMNVSVLHAPHDITAAQQQMWQAIEHDYSFFLVPPYLIIIGVIVFVLLIWLFIFLVKRTMRRRRARRAMIYANELPAAKVASGKRVIIQEEGEEIIIVKRKPVSSVANQVVEPRKTAVRKTPAKKTAAATAPKKITKKKSAS